MRFLKNILLISLLLFGFRIASAEGEIIKDSFGVKGNCSMCESTIENAVKSIDGVVSVKWNVVKQQAIVRFDSEITSLNEIQKVVAAAGYDTSKYKADDEVYDKLHHCCKYDRE